jgi:hypothetical protein
MKKTTSRGLISTLLMCMAFAVSSIGLNWAQTASYPRMAPLAQYQMEREAEIELARSAAPESISREAQILVLGRSGYEMAAAGKNGFVCLVQRSWAAGVENGEFWNPKVRAPICLNAGAARSILPHETKKAEWALAGLSKEQMLERIKVALQSKQFPSVEPGAMCYMMSKHGYLSDNDGHWHPHLMFFTSATDPATWGANQKGSPLLGATNESEHFSVFLLPVSEWSDGTPGPPME